MKIFLILLVAVTTISASAADRRRKTEVPKPDSLASAVDFARAFYAELNREVTLPHPFNTGGGGDIGNIHNREWTYRIPANAFAPKQLSALALRAHKRWNTNWAGAGGQGGGGNQFSAQAFATGVFVFIDVIAYTEGNDTVILLLARCAG